MGVDSFTIHTDGVIERGQEMEPILLNIIEVGSHKKNILAAYKVSTNFNLISVALHNFFVNFTKTS